MGFRTIEEIAESIKNLLADKQNFKKNKIRLHDLCLSIVAARRRAFFSHEGVDFASWDANKEYIKVKKEFLGKNMKLVLTSKEVANRIEKKFGNGTSAGFSVIDKMTEKEKREANRHVSISPVFVGDKSAREQARQYLSEDNSGKVISDVEIVVIGKNLDNKSVAVAKKPTGKKIVNRLGKCEKCKK